ncbi:MAG: segregation ATPase FtsK/SpoIIIE, family [Cryptosporangiaceae bacterium]|nr:segregation ATPase FtsK/SpoIIIE, family [Cryptosporangiaceae bacterium]
MGFAWEGAGVGGAWKAGGVSGSGQRKRVRHDLPRRVRTAGSPPPQRPVPVSPADGPAPVADPLATAAEEQRVKATFGRLGATAAALAAAADIARSAATQEFAVAEREAARATHRSLTGADAEAGEAYDAIRAVLSDRAARLAPGPASAGWDEWQSSPETGIGEGDARHLRLGTLGDSGLPALVPLLGHGNLVVTGEAAWATDVLAGLVLRALGALPAGVLELVVYDPRIRGVFSAFAALRRASARILAEPLATSAEFAGVLPEIRAAVARVAELLGAHGVPDLGALGVQPEPHRIVVVLDYPYGIDPAVHEELLRLADGGPRRGVSLLVHHDPAVAAVHGVDPDRLLAHAVAVSGRAGSVQVSALPGVEVRPDPAPPRELVTAVAARVAERAHTGAAPSVGFADLLPPDTWTHSAAEGMTAVIGTAGFERVELDLRGADPALPNALIGGASGQGKSNLLLVLLHSIAAAYSPDEVEMYLLDYKDGLEFDRLGPKPGRPHWLPHVRVLGLEGDRLFGLAVLRHLDAEFRRRAELFREAGQQHLPGFRRERPGERMPRLLLVIDEFQVLVGVGDEVGREAVGILETLARRGRAVGIHLVLASQTLSGIDALASKERSIFGQFPWRISLKTEASESESVLGRHNTEAAQLRFRGEAIVNREYGSVEHNRRVTVAYADESLLDELRGQWWARVADPRPPRVFYASRPSDPADLPGALARVLARGEDGEHALLGLPVDVDPYPVSFAFRPDPGRALAIVGEGTQAALGTLSAAVYSLAEQALDAEFLLVDGLNPGGIPTPELAVMAALARSRGHTVTEYSRAEAGRALTEAAEKLRGRLGGPAEPPCYLVAPGLHRLSGLDEWGESGETPGEALRQLVAEGPLGRVYLLGWWSTLGVLQQQLRYETSALLGGYLFLRVPEADVQQVVGPGVRFDADPHRGLLWDRSAGGPARPLVPFGVPTPADLRKLGVNP